MVMLSNTPLARETYLAIVTAIISLILAPPAVVSYRRGGARRLWLLWAIPAAFVLALYTIVPRLVVLRLDLPLFALEWALVPVVATGLAVHVLGWRKAPALAQLLVATLLFFAILYPKMGTVITDPMRVAVH